MTDQTTTQTPDCQICGAKTGDDALLCRTHTRRLVDELRGVPALLRDLEVTITRADRVTPATRIGRSAERPLVWNEHAATRRDILRDTLEAWAIDPAALHNHAYTAKAVAGLRCDQQAGEAYDEILDAIRGARHATDLPDAATRFYAGPCPETVDVASGTPEEGNPTGVSFAPCTGDVWAFIPTDPNTPAMLRCRTCKDHRWGTAQWLRTGQRMLARMAELRTVA